MFRHGIRSWLQTYTGEPLPVSVWDSQGGLGVLTNAGIKQMNKFGEFFGGHYKDLVKFDEKNTFARSTDYHRAITSARCFLQGLFGSNSIEVINCPREQDLVRFEKNWFKFLAVEFFFLITIIN